MLAGPNAFILASLNVSMLASPNVSMLASPNESMLASPNVSVPVEVLFWPLQLDPATQEGGLLHELIYRVSTLLYSDCHSLFL